MLLEVLLAHGYTSCRYILSGPIGSELPELTRCNRDMKPETFSPWSFAEVSWWTVLCGIHRVSWRLCARHCYYAGKWCEDVSPRGRWQLSHFLRRGSEFTCSGGTPALNETRSPFISGLPSYMNAKHPWLYDLGRGLFSIKQISNTLNEYSYKIQAWFQSLHS